MKMLLQSQIHLMNARIIEVLNDREVLVDIPYSVNNIVSNFTLVLLFLTYSDFQNEVIGESTLSRSLK